MASSQAQAEITERRLRPLYDAIDNRQNKKALQIADKIIKKQEDLYCAKALKAIVCQRMGRQEEGNSLIDEVVKACPGDQATLQAATMYYRETGDGAGWCHLVIECLI
ncbi:N-alpha-acetyltransferase 25, NatB auxiliary subunit [Geodia barretti]|uniref:N-alpha-acetyltransferase 25, NatB auxiliary subunit n=1 Tax=Geodia barretti TaxID=519541 RepID=A0AA35RP71_GEOBA|nr:N-alpha-acetyltransferase 25, NatB auxiliary subunit [Geodia barretti]